MTAQEGKII